MILYVRMPPSSLEFTTCPMCHRGSPARKPARPDDTTKKVVALDTDICVCNQKATQSDKLIEYHNNGCVNGKYFHLLCMNYKCKSNNAKTTWICPDCSAGNLHNLNAMAKVTNINNANSSNTVSSPKSRNLKDHN